MDDLVKSGGSGLVRAVTRQRRRDFHTKTL